MNKIIEKKWYIIDAENQVLGRLSSNIIKILTGKNNLNYFPNIEGDNIIIINAKKITYNGDKTKKIYYRHSGKIGKLKKTTLEDEFKKNIKKVILHAVKGMLPKNKLSNKLLNNLFIYENENHLHHSQKPIIKNI